MKIRRFMALCIAIMVFATAPALAAPANDNLADATIVAALPYSDTTDTTEATTEEGESLPCGMAGATVWYRFTASEDAKLVADTVGSDFDTVLGVYRTTAADPTFGDLEIVDCNDQAYGDQSRVSFDVISGETYYVQAGGWAPGPLPLLPSPGPARGELVLNVGEASSISGRVTNSGGDGIPYVCVDLMDPDDEYSSVGGTQADQDGNYSIEVSAGSYKVHFIDCDTYTYGEEWYNDKPDFFEADVISVAWGEGVTGIDAVLEGFAPPPPGPPSDLDITELTVTNVPISTDYGDVAYSGWVRNVTVSVSNIGESDAVDAWVDVIACPQTYGYCTYIGSRYIQTLAPGESQTYVMRWTGLGGLGDFIVEAYSWAWNDENYGNNSESVEHYVIVGGLGVGVSAGD